MRPVVRRNALLKLNEARCSQGLGIFQCARNTKQSEYKVALQLYGYKAVTRSIIDFIKNHGLTDSEINALTWPVRGRPDDELDRLPNSRLQSQLLELFNMHLHDINKKVIDKYKGKILLTGFFDLFLKEVEADIIFEIFIFITGVEGAKGYNLGFSSLNDTLRKHIRPIACSMNERFGNFALLNSRSSFEFDSGNEYYGPFEQIKLKIVVPRQVVSTFFVD
ncbi:TPA: hypothetical protein ACKPY3_000820 [Serratia marcescens]|nr:hypothetical protein [Serratia marcescens]